MKMTRRASLVILLITLVVLLGIVFRTLVYNIFVMPVAAVLWLLWRLLVTVDQEIYWELLIFSALIYFILRLTKISTNEVRTATSDPNIAMESVSYWRTSLMVTRDEIEGPNLLKNNLGRLLAAVYASQQPEMPLHEIYTALTLRQIPLPESIYAFLFPAKQVSSMGRARRLLRLISQAPVKWLRKWTGRDVADYYESIEKVITLMESSMEVNDGDERANRDEH